MMQFANILVVCTGNICRSPMAEALFRRALPDTVQLASAGVDALVGHVADALAQQVMQEHGYDLSAHRAQMLTQTMCQQADLILIMDAHQQHVLDALSPTDRGKIMRLGHWIQRDIPDPYHQSREAFEFVYSLMEQSVHVWVPRLVFTR